jgi:hypothetical protein
MICLATQVRTTIAGRLNTSGNCDGIGTEATFHSTYDIALHKKTGDFFVVEDYPDHVRKLSRVNAGETGEWMVSSIRVLLPHCHDYFFLSVFCDTIFLTTWATGQVIQSSLDGKTASVMAQFRGNNRIGVAVNASGAYVSLHRWNIISRIDLPRLFWSSENHQHMNWHIRELVGIVALASLCQSNSSTSRCQLRRLPREILFHVLSFIDSSSHLTTG